MTVIPKSTIHEFVQGLKLRARGKVRDSFDLPNHEDKMLVVATDRVSIFDIVLNALVPLKGQVLNAMNVFWRTKIFGDLFSHDMVAYGDGINEFLPVSLRDNEELMTRAAVVYRMNMLDFEAIVRGFLTGSGLKDYRNDGTVGGHHLPIGLNDGSRLPFPIFTPSTKAKEGHDINITADAVAEKYGVWPERLALQLYMMAVQFVLERRVIIADTKFELGDSGFGDEVLTPDSSRFWDSADWQKAQAEGRSPQSFDKQFVREWGKGEGIHELDPTSADAIAKIAALEVPESVIDQTTQLYRYIFWRLTGMRLEFFQRDIMNVPVKLRPRCIRVIIGSESDKPQCEKGFAELRASRDRGDIEARVDVISCHRNADMLRGEIMRDDVSDVIIAGAGLAAALPGMVKSWLREVNMTDTPVLGVAFQADNERQDRAAQLSIEELPGRPVELNPKTGKAYFGEDGFVAACRDAVGAEFMAREAKSKSSKLNIRF